MSSYNTNPIDLNNEFIPLPKHILLPPSLGSDACPWLDEYITYSTTWSPRSYEGYHVATGLFVLSTVASRRVGYEFSRIRFTNLYFALVGRSSITYKSTAARIGKDVLIAAGLDWMLLPDTTTPQKMINLMSTTVPENYQSLSIEQKGRILEQLKFAGQKGWHYEEFGQMFIDMMKSNGPTADFKSHLRRLDDTPDRFGNGTIARGLETIEYPYLSILGILTPDDLLPYAKRESALWGDGFLARFFLVAPDPDFYSNEQFPRGLGVIPATLIDPLIKWHEELGILKVEILGIHAKIMQPDRQVLKLSEEVFIAYYAYDDGIKQITRSRTNHDLDGNYARFPEKALRIAAIFASLSGSPTIEINHLARALMITEQFREDLHNLYSQISENKSVQKPSNEEKVLRAINRKGNPKTREIEQFTGLLKHEVQLAIDHLVDRGTIDEIPDGNAIRCVIAQPKNTALLGYPAGVESVERRSVDEYNKIQNSNIKEK